VTAFRDFGDEGGVALVRENGCQRGDAMVVCLPNGTGFTMQDTVQRLTEGVEIPLIDVEALATP